jgi:hypothetical protein|tara:strand:+ start:725 stop:1063 length:339 start_codon:yes stop_codon:yes gene_type:complete
MPIRYNKRSVLNSRKPIDERSVRKRNTNSLTYFSLDSLRHPTQEDYDRIGSRAVIWDETTRLSKLASKHLGNFEYWWVIAWWNKKPTDAHYKVGDVVYIPNNLTMALEALGV